MGVRAAPPILAPLHSTIHLVWSFLQAGIALLQKACELLARDSWPAGSSLANRRFLQDRSGLRQKFSMREWCRWPPFCRFAENLHRGPRPNRPISSLSSYFPTIRSIASCIPSVEKPKILARRAHSAFSAAELAESQFCVRKLWPDPADRYTRVHMASVLQSHRKFHSDIESPRLVLDGSAPPDHAQPRTKLSANVRGRLVQIICDLHGLCVSSCTAAVANISFACLHSSFDQDQWAHCGPVLLQPLRPVDHSNCRSLMCGPITRPEYKKVLRIFLSRWTRDPTPTWGAQYRPKSGERNEVFGGNKKKR